MNKCKLKTEEKWLVIAIPIIFIVGSLLHFVYDWTGQIKLIGLFVPINESVWEHLKLLLLPIILWWLIFYALKGKKLKIDKDKWFTGCLVALISSMLFMIAFFYSYTGAFGKDILAIDILDMFLSVTFGQILGLYIYRHLKRIKWWISLVAIVLIVILFAIFTIYPPELPIFLERSN